ncbi:MAG: flagellar motor switch protein FliN [Phycisphaerales bacterium JB040]
MSEHDRTDDPTPKSGPPAQGEAPDTGKATGQRAHPAETAADRASESAEAVAREVNDEANAGVPTEAESGALESASRTAGAVWADLEGDGARPFSLDSFESEGSKGGGSPFSLLDDVNLDVKIELGRTRMYVEDVLKLGEGAVVELDKLAGDPVDIYVNNRHVARGEILVLNDNFCVRVSEILDPNTDDS